MSSNSGNLVSCRKGNLMSSNGESLMSSSSGAKPNEFQNEETWRALETSQWWRAVSNIASDLIAAGFDPQTFRSRDKRATARLTFHSDEST